MSNGASGFEHRIANLKTIEEHAEIMEEFSRRGKGPLEAYEKILAERAHKPNIRKAIMKYSKLCMAITEAPNDQMRHLIIDKLFWVRKLV